MLFNRRRICGTDLVFGSLAPFGLVVLGSRLDHSVHTKTETEDISQLLDLLSTILETTEIAEVLSNSPDSLLGVDVLMVPVNQLVGGCQILCDGLLREHMLASRQSFLDEIGLSEDGKGNNYCFDV
jgi:hypothetical protein